MAEFVPGVAGLTTTKETAFYAFCESCAQKGKNPVLYQADSYDSVALRVALSIKYHPQGHAVGLSHQVHLIDNRKGELLDESDVKLRALWLLFSIER